MDGNGQSRRRFIGSALATAGAVAAGAGWSSAMAGDQVAWAERKPSRDDYDAIVVGAGFAGLVAARDLSKAGLNVLLLEARNRIGGRTFTSAYHGKKIELGGTWIHWSQPHVWAEMTRYGLGIEESPGASPDRASWLTGGRLKNGSADKVWPMLAEGMAKFCDVDGQGGRLVLPLAHDPLARRDLLLKWDQVSLQGRLDQLSISREAKDVLAPQLAINCHNDPRKAGMADMLRWWALGDYDMGRMFDKLGRYKVREGMSRLAERILADSTAAISLSTPVKAIDQQGSRYTVRTASGRTFATNALVMAVPLNVLGSIALLDAMAEEKRVMTGPGHTGNGVKCYIHIKQKIGKWMGMAPFPNPITLVWTEKEMDDGTLLVCFGPPGLLDVNDEAAVQDALRRLLPKAEVLGVTAYQWDVDPYAKGTWCWYRPGQLTQGLEVLRKPSGGIFMAGSDSALGWRGFVDGALESGITAARDVRQYLKG